MTKSILDGDLELIGFVPPSIVDDVDGEIIAMCKAIDPELREVAAAIIEAIILPRIADVPENILDELAWGFNLSNLQIWDVASVEKKRELLANIFQVRKKSGTRFAVRRTFELMELDAEIVEWWEEPTAGVTESPDPEIPIPIGYPYTYRIRIFLNDEEEFTRSQWIQLWELTYRFEPTRAKLLELATERDESGSLFVYPAPQTGRLVTVSFGG